MLAEHSTYVDTGLTNTDDGRLLLPADDVFWGTVKARLARRSGIAFINADVATGLRDETVLLEEKISTYLERSR